MFARVYSQADPDRVSSDHEEHKEMQRRGNLVYCPDGVGLEACSPPARDGAAGRTGRIKSSPLMDFPHLMLDGSGISFLAECVPNPTTRFFGAGARLFF